MPEAAGRNADGTEPEVCVITPAVAPPAGPGTGAGLVAKPAATVEVSGTETGPPEPWVAEGLA